ncbi:CHAT domain-containing protein [Novosphingobium sp. CF614]|uniref:CHAT domain-containing protein n=1 Tax=Novosphingobium sp. CF614 TaxID=1884364 RepID=UPI0008EF0972|nr:CHAT domain-containing protein [Novosphingobium sp. CF614]SFG14792.1 CHAT domain-containing protein [Novosphingobium sp. CF614]
MKSIPMVRGLKTTLALASSLSILAAMLAASPALAAGSAPERFDLGTNANGDSCSASRLWNAGEGPVRYDSDQPYLISCRGIAAADAQGYLSAANKPTSLDNCGAAVSVDLAGIGPAEVRRCIDATLGKVAVDVRFSLAGVAWQGAALDPSVGALEAALRVLALGAALPNSDTAAKSSIDLAAIPAGQAFPAVGEGRAITPEAALADGVAALQTGRLLDASRTLNDALRAFATADVSTRIDLRLAAGLAESNLSQFELAEGHFAVAKDLLRTAQNLPRGDQQEQQLATYRGIDLINQHRWPEAIAALARENTRAGGLADPLTLSRLNEEATASADSLQSQLGDESLLTRSLLEAQRNLALSVAYLGSNQVDAADAALRKAAEAGRVLVTRITPERIVWLRTVIERQQARIDVRRGNIGRALAHFDCAINALSGGLPGGGCLFAGGQPVSDTFQNAPLLVETRLERASVASRDPALDSDRVLANYRQAMQSLPNLQGTGYVSLAALERYFVLLTKVRQTEARDEEYFHAMQMIGEPAIAREYAQLQKVVSADAGVADLLRRRGLLERQLIRLRTEISGLGVTSGPEFEKLEQERQAADAERDTINSQLIASNGIGALEDEPATIAQVRAALMPGEAYLKLSQLYSTMFGIVITRDQTWIYEVAGGLAKTDALADGVLTSARMDEATRTISLFQVTKASQLFQAITGPAADAVAHASRIIYNPAGKLRQLPFAVLVTDPASADTYEKQRLKGDYSQVSFVAHRTETAVALSPRAFLRVRSDVAPSRAPGKFLGIGESAAPEPAGPAAAQSKMPFDCSVTYATWAGYLGQIKPISAHEISVAATALGVADPPEITGAAFTDVSLLNGPASTELGRYQILHFATHGLPETQVDLPQCKLHLPPALLTTLAAPASDGQVLSDGLLSFDEVARLELDANLVVLSACDTAAGTSAQTALKAGLENSSPALDGLVRSFIAARARAVMATFWAVPVLKESDDLMATFYGIGRTGAMSNSLRIAQNQMIDTRRYSHPYYWGAYFLVGDGAKTMLSQPGQVAMK